MDVQRKPALVKQILKRWRLLLGCNGHVESPTSHWKQHQAIDDLAWTKLRNIEAPESMASTTTSRTPQKWIGDWSWGLLASNTGDYLEASYIWMNSMQRWTSLHWPVWDVCHVTVWCYVYQDNWEKHSFFLICFYERWFQDRGKCTLFIYLVFYIVYPCD
jgi:hypothetical protein